MRKKSETAPFIHEISENVGTVPSQAWKELLGATSHYENIMCREVDEHAEKLQGGVGICHV